MVQPNQSHNCGRFQARGKIRVESAFEGKFAIAPTVGVNNTGILSYSPSQSPKKDDRRRKAQGNVPVPPEHFQTIPESVPH